MNDEKKVDKSIILKWVLSLGLGIIIWFIPLGISNELQKFFAISVSFIVMVALDLMPTLLISMVLPCVYMLAGIADASTALQPWTNTLMYLVTAGMIFANVMTDCGLMKRLALWFLRKCGNSFNVLVYGLFFVCLFMACISFCQAWLLMLTLAIALCKAMGYGPKEKPTLVLCMAAFCGSLASTVYTYNPAYVPFLDSAVKSIDPNATYVWYQTYIYMAPYILICLLFLFILTKIYKTKNYNVEGGKEYFDGEYKKLGKVSTREKKAAVSLVFLLLFIVTSSFHGLATLYGFIAAVVYLFLPGIDVGRIESVTKINMGTIAFMVACCSIGTVGSALGFDTLVTNLLSSLLKDAGPFKVLYTIFGLGTVGKLVMTPLALLSCLATPIAQLGQQLGINPLGALNALHLSTDMYVMPYQNAWTMAFFAMGMIEFKDFIKVNVIRVVMLAVGLGILFIPWWIVLGVL